MTAAQIRQRFLDFFESKGHRALPSSPLVPKGDPTLLFTNAGMVQFKKIFLGQEEAPYRRAVTSQKCVRAGGKHNDLEEVGRTARHHTFFEMLGNFSFGDYFKRDAVGYAWEFLTGDLGMDPDRLYVSVHETDQEAADLWQEVAGVEPDRIYTLGDKDNFWQMADTGPCGPCSELHYDMRPDHVRGDGSIECDAFVAAGERGEFLEIWNLVFMQFNRDEEGTLHPLPAPSIDTGAGLERIASILQGVDSNYHTDAFLPLLEKVATVVGRPYEADGPEGVSYRVLADHARAVAFLLADGVYPSSEGRGYVLRRILRRAVRHAWLLGRREPSLVEVVDTLIEEMGDVYPELTERRAFVLDSTRAEEERFLLTIEGGMARFDQLAPPLGDDATGDHVIDGAEAFRLYDTFGFPLDLTDLMARERGYHVDVEAFEAALDEQRQRSRADRATSGVASGDEILDGWDDLGPRREQTFSGYDNTRSESRVLAVRQGQDRLGLQLESNPFYLEAGGQVSDLGQVTGPGWTLAVDDVRRVGDRVAILGTVTGEFVVPGSDDLVTAQVHPRVRHDTERNHTATHLLHAALRKVLGEHVVQRGSLVTRDRLRFDFAHTSPMTSEEIASVESDVNESIWDDHPVATELAAYDEAVSRGAMALFGEKYGDEVRVVTIPGISIELCGGTHLRHTSEVGPFTIVSESGVAAGVRRIEALTGPAAVARYASVESSLKAVAEALRTTPENAGRRATQLIDEKRELETVLGRLRAQGGAGESVVVDVEIDLGFERPTTYRGVRLTARDADDARMFGDSFLSGDNSGAMLVAAELPGDRHSLFAFVSDDLIGKGIRADQLVREAAALVGGKGGGRPHMAQAGVGDPSGIESALEAGQGILKAIAESATG